MRKKLRTDICDRAYEYIKTNGEMTANGLVEALRQRKSTGRLDSGLPSTSRLAQWLRMDKRFVGVYRPVANFSQESTHLLLHYSIVEGQE